MLTLSARIAPPLEFPSSSVWPAIHPPSSTQIYIISSVSQIRQLRDAARSAGRLVTLVPTMGALHAGHLDLIAHAAANAADVVVSVYVNPTQFGVNEDVDTYPRTFAADLRALEELNERLLRMRGVGRVAAVFMPSTSVMYPTLPPTSEIDGAGSFVIISPLGQILEGAVRPVFFRGVATVVMKLLNIVQPDEVFFGQKDVQQLVLVQRMIRDFHVRTKLRMVETGRLDNDLAQSSRNAYLGPRRFAVAPVLYSALQAGMAVLTSSKASTRQDIIDQCLAYVSEIQARQAALDHRAQVRFEVEYFSVADPTTMQEVNIVDLARGAILSGAIKMLPLAELRPDEAMLNGEPFGNRPVRLIDNVFLHADAVQETMGL